MLMPRLAIAVSGLLCWATALTVWSAMTSQTFSARARSMPWSSSSSRTTLAPRTSNRSGPS